jgi:hypothetical protein
MLPPNTNGDSTTKLDGSPHSSVPEEAKRILMDCLIGNTALDMPAIVCESAPIVAFTPDIEPFMPTPMKMTESVSALWGCIGLFASAISKERYKVGKAKSIKVDVYSATLMLFSLVLFEVNGNNFGDGEIAARAAHIDKGNISETYRSMATNMYVDNR